MSFSGRAERADSSLRTDSGTSFIDLPFDFGRAARRDDANLRFIGYGLLSVGNEQQTSATNHSNRLPTLFSSFDSLQSADVQWVIEHQNGSLKTDSVLLAVGLVLSFIPGEQA
jgi:hypothetical protein